MSRRFLLALTCAVALAGVPGCAKVLQQDKSSSYLIVDAFAAASGAAPNSFGGTLASDVQTYVKRDVGGTQVLVPTIFEDLGKVTLRLGMKDPGTTATPTTPSTANYITVTRYRVTFTRADGRNTAGVDVPYGFDGAITLTVGETPVSAGLTLVRLQAKSEAPLKALIGGNGAFAISTIAEITFHGQDQAGREVSVTAKISVTFADWGDPA